MISATSPSSIDPLVPHAGIDQPRSWLRSDAPSIDLDGEWDFAYHPQGVDDDDRSWITAIGGESIVVPGHWQLQGYGLPYYANVAYPFPIDPPNVPRGAVGDYHRALDLPSEWVGGSVVLRFEGVDSWFAVAVNGHEIGYSSGSRLPSEFEVGELLKPGSNDIAVRVWQWSPASYVEDQDQWWLSGIFRSVVLQQRPVRGLRDVSITAGFEGGIGRFSCDVDGDPETRVKIDELGLDLAPGEVAECPVEPWSAENPRLYDVEIVAPGETVRLRTGFRTVAIDDGILTVNGRRIVFRGVNRHEFHPDRGRALTEQDMIDDVLLMKRHNVNAVRTSHYPPHPRFLELCDEYGLYVIDEADLETHGFVEEGWRGNPSDDPAWRQVYLDRMERMVERDKNVPSIVLWSLGNEAGSGTNLVDMYRWAKDRDPGRPVHYEADPAVSDVFSRMYSTQGEVAAYGRGEAPDASLGIDPADVAGKPFILCEYGHAMGNGAGGLREYVESFRAFPRCQGGFIWEWLDHGIRTAPGVYAYGGDFGEPLHNSNFVIDGLLFPDRTPSPALDEYERLIQPIDIAAAGDDISVTNEYDHVDSSHLAFRWRIDTEAGVLAEGVLDVPVLAPGESVVVDLDSVRSALGDHDGEAWVRVEAVTARATAWAEAGHLIARGQVSLAARAAAPSLPSAPPRRAGDVIEVGIARLDRHTGALLTIDGIAVGGPAWSVWRAPIDNDRVAPTAPLTRWRSAGFDRMLHRVDTVTVDDGSVRVRGLLAPAARAFGFDVEYVWTPAIDGSIRLEASAIPRGVWPDVPLPRIGLDLVVADGASDATWFGLGPGETYSDSTAAAWVGRHERTLAGLQTPYVFPQENGHRSGTRWLELRSPASRVLRIEGDDVFGFTARPWTSADLDAATHRHLLSERRETFVGIDVAQHGIGSAACGPEPLAEHRLGVGPVSIGLRFSARR